MKLHELSPAEGSTKESKRIGRGHGSGLLALVALAGCLAVTGTAAAALAEGLLDRARCGRKFMKFQFTCTSFGYASVTSTRWLIFTILPFVAALSG